VEIVVTEAQGRVPVSVFKIKGPITSNVELEARAKAAYDAGARNILIDLSEVPYIATYGLRALHYIYTLLRTSAPEESDDAVRKGIGAGTFMSPHLRILKPTPHALEALKVAGYDMFLEIHRDYNKAISAF
jgi:2-iminoacetate synthase ThiH